MLARFARDAVTYGGATVIVRAVGFLLLPIYTRFLSPSDYGMVELLTIVGAFAFVTVALEVGQGAARHLPESTGERRAEYVSASLAFAVPAYIAFAIALILAAGPVASRLLGRPDATTIVQVAAVTIALMGVFQLAHGELRWMMQARRWAAINVAYVVSAGVVGAGLVAVVRVGPVGILLGWAAAAALGLVLVSIAGRGMYRLRWHRERLAEMLRFSVPLVPSSIAVIAMASVDRVIVNNNLGLSDVGMYGVGLRVASIVGVVMLAFQASLAPLIYATHREPDTPRQISQLLRAFVLAAGAASIGLALFAPEVVALVAARQFADASRVVPLLATATMVGGMYVFTPGLAIGRRTGLVAAVSIGAAVAATVAGIFLVPTLGMIGGAVAALVGALVLFVGNAVLGAREYAIPFSWLRIAIVGGIVLAVDVAMAYLEIAPLDAVIPRVITLIACTVLIVALGPISSAEMKAVGGRVARRWQSGAT
jgi:O-antigen/teichoic acid export membrane protein